MLLFITFPNNTESKRLKKKKCKKTEVVHEIKQSEAFWESSD